MPIPSQAEYERRERLLFIAALKEVESEWKTHSPIVKETLTQEFLDAMAKDPDVIRQRIEWLLEGHYGKGAYDVAHEVVANKRMNREAWLTHTVGAIEWDVPQHIASSTWKKLTEKQKKSLDASVRRAMKRASGS